MRALRRAGFAEDEPPSEKLRLFSRRAG
jgi:hypothetical protein